MSFNSAIAHSFPHWGRHQPDTRSVFQRSFFEVEDTNYSIYKAYYSYIIRKDGTASFKIPASGRRLPANSCLSAHYDCWDLVLLTGAARHTDHTSSGLQTHNEEGVQAG